MTHRLVSLTLKHPRKVKGGIEDLETALSIHLSEARSKVKSGEWRGFMLGVEEGVWEGVTRD